MIPLYVSILLFFCHGISLYAMADLSLVVIDLKYNQELGVKICEMQPGSFSRFSGSDALDGKNAVTEKYCDILSEYKFLGYFTHPLYQEMKKSLINRGWRSTHSAKELAAKLYPTVPNDPDNLFDYQCCLFSLQIDPVLHGEPTRFPQILFLDRAILPYSRNKYTMNCLFDKIEEAKKIRPVWKVYKKGVSKELIDQITLDIPGNIIVIKPIQSTMGRGVIILDKKDLESTLNYIFLSSKETLLNDLERSYSQYAIDPSHYFIVEEFIPSDPILLGDTPLPYDCTMRIIALLSYHQKVPSITFLSQYWYSPHKPIDEAYTLIQSHKAKGTHFFQVDPDLSEEIKSQISPALLKLYEYMLTQYDAQHPSLAY